MDTGVIEETDYVDISTCNRFIGKSLQEMLIEQMNLINDKNTMTAGEQIEKAVKMAEQVPALQSKIDSLTDKVGKMKNMSDYVECEVCGSLVNEDKAQVFSSVKLHTNAFYFNIIGGFAADNTKEAVLHYVCNHCDANKYEKELKKRS